MVCAPVRSIIPELKLGDYLSVPAHKPCSISHLCLLTSDVCFRIVNLGITNTDISKHPIIGL